MSVRAFKLKDGHSGPRGRRAPSQPGDRLGTSRYEPHPAGQKLREPEGRVRYLEPTEIDRLLAACPTHLRPIVVCALHTGMRRGEIFGLTWNLVDLKNRLIRVTGTKSGRPRVIPIDEPLLDELRHLPRRLKTDHVFWNHETETRFVSLKKAWAT